MPLDDRTTGPAFAAAVKVGKLVSRIVDTDQPGVVAAYEAEIAKLNARKAGLV